MKLTMITSNKNQPSGHKEKFAIKIIIYTLLVFLPIFLLMNVMTIVVMVIQEKLEMKVLMRMEENIVEVYLENTETEINHVTSDLLILTLNSHIEKLWDDSNNTEVIKDLTEDFLNVVVNRKLYDQGRLIDENGMEIIRISFNNGNPVVIPKAKLQNKKHRYYFKDAFKLNRNEIFVSPLDLNIEDSKIVQPLKPMIRFATPVFDQQGVKRGIILLNYLGQIIINQLDNQANLIIESQVMLLNNDGYWLKGPLPENEWGFMYEDKKNITFSSLYHDAWNRIKNEESSQFETQQGLFTFKTIYPLCAGQESSTDSGITFLSSETQLINKDYNWKIVSYIPSEILYAKHNERRKYVALLLIFLSISFLFISWRLAKAQYSRNKALQALKISNETKDKFFSIIAHDLRNPFNTMLGFSKILDENFDKYDTKEKKKFINIIHKGLQDTFKLLENLLYWSSSQRGIIGFNPEQINLYLISEKNIELLNQSAKNKFIKLINQIPENIYVDADKDMLSTIMRNLISNAVKFTPKGGEITIKARLTTDDNNKYAEITIKDSGIGILKDIQTELFNIGENTSTRGTENEKGTGIGLILCKEFVEKHGGKIWIESEVGKGSSFFFTIPYKSENLDNVRI